jgi:hypothetical protein
MLFVFVVLLASVYVYGLIQIYLDNVSSRCGGV